MSFQTFLASDKPMANVENPHIKLLSVNEALQKGVVLPDTVLNSPTIDRDKPGVILWADDEENLGEISITDTDKAYLGKDDSPLETDLPYFSSLEWHYTKERAEKLIAYIRKHLKQANEIEIWNLWIGYEEITPKIRKCSVYADKLTAADFEKLFYSGQRNGDLQQYDCLTAKRS